MYVRARVLAASGLAVALLSAGAGGAMAATAPLSHAASITVKASPTTAKPGQTVRFAGRTSGIRPGASVMLQMDKSGKWIPLHVDSKVKKGDTYALATRVHMKGSQQFRVTSGQTHSPTVHVTVQ
ncbi:hypothetical protein ACIRBZ_04970 [Streptomyces sp. NPDC094038]|uniref:hypothetical protein n=1 Tax=Streptomyces sp. NPDC094038 TaxID=3366055 RepID=UPI0038291865